MAQNPKITKLGTDLVRESIETLGRKNLAPKDWEAMHHLLHETYPRLDHWGKTAIKKLFTLHDAGFACTVTDAVEEMASKPRERKTAKPKDQASAGPKPVLS